MCIRDSRTCSACPAGTFQSSLQHRDTACAAWDACSAGTTCETRAPSASVNRLCSAVNVCSGTEYMKVAPTLAHGACGTCASHATCTGAQYETVAATTTSDRECELKECTACTNGSMATGAACAQHGGATCASCDGGYYLSSGACVAQPYCGKGQKITPYSTTQAGSCVACGADEYQLSLIHI